MAVYHMVLFELKPGVTSEVLSEWKKLAQSMVGQIPGLIRVDLNPPHASTAHRSLGYDMGLVAILDKPETLKVYAEHPAHLAVHKIREEICARTMVYDLEYDP